MKQKIFPLILLTCLAVLGLSLIPSNAFAQTSTEDLDDLLSRAYAAERTWLEKQQTAIDKTDQGVEKVQAIIERAAAQGLDVTALETALAAFQEAMVTVRSEHQTAADILATHAGFDENGVVIDRPAARETVREARRALGSAHMIMTQAVWDLRDAVRAWREANLPQE